MVRSILALAVVVVLCGGVKELRADIVYSTPGFGNEPTGGWKDSYFADPFTLSTPSMLTSITFELTIRNDKGFPQPTTLDFGVLSDNSNAPGTVLFGNAAAPVINAQDSGPLGLYPNLDLWELTVSTGSLNLGATQFWIALGLDGVNPVFWAATDTTNHQTYYSGDTYSSGQIGGPYVALDSLTQFQYQIEEHTAVPQSVPEPFSLLLVGSGLAGMWGVRRQINP